MDINNLTIVQSLAFDTIRWELLKNDKPIVFNITSLWSSLYDVIHSLPEEYISERNELGDKLDDALLAYDKRKSLNNLVNLRSAYNKLKWPSVKIPSYTKEQAIAEFREVIEFVRSRYEEAR